MKDIYESILESIKKLIGIDKDYGAFDIDLIIAINSSFTILNQLGVGPDEAYSITGPDDTWLDFFGTSTQYALVKSYIYLRARLLFDPPSSGVLHEAVERQISEFEWRLKIQAERDKPSTGDGDSGEEPPENPDEPTEFDGDHNKLTHREDPDQHPIEAITGLSEELEKIPAIMTAEELDKILIN